MIKPSKHQHVRILIDRIYLKTPLCLSTASQSCYYGCSLVSFFLVYHISQNNASENCEKKLLY